MSNESDYSNSEVNIPIHNACAKIRHNIGNVSVCVGSVWGGSVCVGSVWGGSVCVGSAWGGSVFVGSAGFKGG